MKQKLIELLKTLGHKVMLQGSLNTDATYPDTFFTFWNFEKSRMRFYNNQPLDRVWGFWVYLYSDDPETLENTMDAAIKLLRNNGFIVDGDAIDADSGRPTHSGSMITVYYVEKIGGKENE